MPACKPWCPVVKNQLKKIVTEAPWLLKKDLPSKEADLEKDIEFKDARDVGRRYEREADGKIIDIVTDITQEDTSDYQLVPIPEVPITKVKRESATQWIVEGKDKMIVREPIKDIEGEDSAARLSERGRLERERPERERPEREKLEHEKLELEKLERDKLELEKLKGKKIKKSDGEPLRHEAIDERELTIFRDECSPHCPRRISRKNRIRKLEEKQRAVDYYLLTKGSGYFEDVCTCSLSCIIQALENDLFVRSILASAALFVFGLKLCSELDAWYLPT